MNKTNIYLTLYYA